MESSELGFEPKNFMNGFSASEIQVDKRFSIRFLRYVLFKVQKGALLPGIQQKILTFEVTLSQNSR